MKVAQIYTILNTIKNETLGDSAVLNEDLSNVVDIGTTIIDATGVDNYVKKLVNHIGKVIFVDRKYHGKAPNVLMDGWEYGSILEKIDCDLPDSVENKSWELANGNSYDQDTFTAPKNVRAKFFNNRTTFEVDMSYTEMQVKESFSNVTQLNAFMSMIETKIQNRLTLDYKNLIMRTINNFSAATIYKEFSDKLTEGTHLYDFGNNSGVRAVNLLGLYKEKVDPQSALTAETCMTDLAFLKFASSTIMLYSDYLEDYSTLFNIGGKERFTPKDKQHLVLLSQFVKKADVYLQSVTFHEEFTKLPKSEVVNFWQGSGTDFGFDSTSKLHITTDKLFAKDSDTKVVAGVEMIVSGIIGVLFDHDALGVTNKDNRVPSHFNAKGEFVNFFYKSDAQYFNDYDENFVVFFVA